jgi:hypothetical protein
VLDNQRSGTDGDGSTMYPFIDTGDPAAELQQASLSTDDMAFASYFYPEGSAASGPGALQAGDVRFGNVYGLITGELRHGVLNQPIAGGQLRAVDRNTGQALVSAYSGTANLSFNPANGGLFFVPTAAAAITNGNYTIPVPQGNYDVLAEAVDGQPAAAANIGFTCQIGGFFGQQNFIEEFWNNQAEGAIEREPGDAKNAHVNTGPGQLTSGVNITTNNVFTIAGFGARNAIGFINPPAGGFIYAQQFPASQITALNGGNPVLLQAGLFDTNVVDASVPVVFARAMLTTGVINPDTTATIDLGNPLASETLFVGQDGDFAPFYFKNPHDLSEIIRLAIANGTIQNLFLVIQIQPGPFPGVSAQPPLLGLSTQAPILGRSFLSTNGGLTFNRRNDLNFRIAMIASQVPVQ